MSINQTINPIQLISDAFDQGRMNNPAAVLVPLHDLAFAKEITQDSKYYPHATLAVDISGTLTCLGTRSEPVFVGH